MKNNKNLSKQAKNAVLVAASEWSLVKKGARKMAKGIEASWKETAPERRKIKSTVAKKWAATAPKRAAAERAVKKAVKTTTRKVVKKVDANTKGFLSKTIRASKDVARGVKQGVRAAKKSR